MTAKYITTATIDTAIASTFSCSQRTTPCDLAAIKAKAIKMFGHNIALAWALKMACFGMKVKPGDFVKISGTTQTAAEFLAILTDPKKNTGYVAKDGGGLAKVSDKSAVSSKRLVRAFASDIIAILKKGIKLSDEYKALSDLAACPASIAFLYSWYGLDDDALKANSSKLYKLCLLFDEKIDFAYKLGAVSGSQKHSHAEEFKNYLAWRNFTVTDKVAEEES